MDFFVVDFFFQLHDTRNGLVQTAEQQQHIVDSLVSFIEMTSIRKKSVCNDECDVSEREFLRWRAVLNRFLIMNGIVGSVRAVEERERTYLFYMSFTCDTERKSEAKQMKRNRGSACY